MSLLLEIAKYRKRFKEVSAQDEAESDLKYPIYKELPPGFFKNLNALSRFLRSDKLIYETTDRFMGDIRISDYKLSRRFFPRHDSQIRYILKFGVNNENCIKSGCLKCSEEEDYWYGNSFSSVFDYEVGNNENSEGLVIKFTPVLVPKKKDEHWIDAKKALTYIRSEESVFLNSLIVSAYGITEESIRDILTILLCNPKLKLETQGFSYQNFDDLNFEKDI